MARVDGDESFAKELLSVFLVDIPPKIADLQEAIRAGDHAEVEHLAHSLKGAAGTVRADQLHDQAFRLETAAKNRKADDYLALCAGIDQLFACVQEDAAARGIEAAE